MNTQQQAYQEQVEAQLNEWRAQVDVLKAKARKAEAQAKIQLQKHIDELRRKEETVRSRVGELQHAGADAWASLQAGVEAAVRDLRKGLEKS